MAQFQHFMSQRSQRSHNTIFLQSSHSCGTSDMKCVNIQHFFLIYSSASNDARSPTKITICVFPDCNSAIAFFDLHDHDLIKIEKTEACFAYKTNCFYRFHNVVCLETHDNPLYLVPQDVPKDIQSRFHVNGKRYNYKCFGA